MENASRCKAFDNLPCKLSLSLAEREDATQSQRVPVGAIHGLQKAEPRQCARSKYIQVTSSSQVEMLYWPTIAALPMPLLHDGRVCEDVQAITPIHFPKGLGESCQFDLRIVQEPPRFWWRERRLSLSDQPRWSRRIAMANFIHSAFRCATRY